MITLIIPKAELAHALKTVMPIVPGRASLPVLSHLKIKTYGGGISIVATNLEQTVEADCAAEVDGAGEFLAPAQKLSAMVAALDGPEIIITHQKDKETKVSSGATKYTLETFSAKEFPETPKLSAEAVELKLHGGDLLRALCQVRHAQSTDESRSVLCGVLIEVRPNGLMAVATDGRRLALSESGSQEGPAAQALLPKDAVSEICKVLAESDPDSDLTVSIWFDSTRGQFTMGSTKLCTKLIDGQYPNFRQVIPSENKHAISISTGDLLAKVRQVRIVSDVDSPSIKLSFTEAGVGLESHAAELGSAESLMQFSLGFDLAIACSPTFLAEALKATQSDEVEFCLTDALSPIVLKAADQLQVIMPIRGK